MRCLSVVVGAVCLALASSALAAENSKARPSAGAPARESTAKEENVPPLSYETLLWGYLEAHPKLVDDLGFVAEWAQYEQCEKYTALRRNEFEYNKFLGEVQEGLRSRLGSRPLKQARIRTKAQFGDYDFARQEFLFQPLSEGSFFTIEWRQAPPPSGAVHNKNSCKSGTFADSWPQFFVVTPEHPERVRGIPMQKAAAEAFLKERSAKFGPDRNLGLTLVLEPVSWGAPEIRKEDGRMHFGKQVPVVFRIASAMVDDGGKSPKTIFSYDAAYLQAQDARIAEDKAAAEQAARKAKQANLGPSLQADVLGIRPGMSLAEAEDKLKAYDATAAVERQQKQLADGTSYPTILRLQAVKKMEGKDDVQQERIFVFLSGPSTGGKVIAVVREAEYSGQFRPDAEGMGKALEEKYGKGKTPTGKPLEFTESGWFDHAPLWLIDEGRVVLEDKAYVLGGCRQDSTSITFSGECRTSLALRLTGKNRLVEKFSVGLVDHQLALNLIKKDEAYADQLVEQIRKRKLEEERGKAAGGPKL